MTNDTPIPPAETPVPPTAPTNAPLEPAAPRELKNDDLVYVDPDTKTVIGPVEWSRNGNPKSKPYVQPPSEKEHKRGRKHYPFGTYKSMKGAFKLEGKQKKMDPGKTLDDVIEKALKEPFWD